MKLASKEHLPGNSTLSAPFWDVDLRPKLKGRVAPGPVWGFIWARLETYLVGWFAVKSFETKVDNICFEQHFEDLHCLGW